MSPTDAQDGSWSAGKTGGRGKRRQVGRCSRAQRGWATRETRGATGADTMGVRRNKRSRGTRAGAITTERRRMVWLVLRASLVGGPSEASTPKKKN